MDISILAERFKVFAIRECRDSSALYEHLSLQIADDPDDFIWMKALIWPDHIERAYLFERAARFVRNQSFTLFEGDGVKMLVDIVSTIPHESVVCVFHTHVANQIPKEDKAALQECIRSIGNHRDIFHLYNNMWDAHLHLDYYVDGVEHLETLAETDGHGRWFMWSSKKSAF